MIVRLVYYLILCVLDFSTSKPLDFSTPQEKGHWIFDTTQEPATRQIENSAVYEHRACRIYFIFIMYCCFLKLTID